MILPTMILRTHRGDLELGRIQKLTTNEAGKNDEDEFRPMNSSRATQRLESRHA